MRHVSGTSKLVPSTRRFRAFLGNMTIKKIVESYIREIWNNGKIEAIDDFLSPAFVAHGLVSGNDIVGIPQLIDIYHDYKRDYPNLKVKVLDMLSESDKVAGVIELISTHPDRDTQAAREMIIHRIQDCRIVESWSIGGGFKNVGDMVKQ